MAANYFTLILITTALLGSTVAQFENLAGCLTADFFTKFGGCLATSILEELSPLPLRDTENQHGPGRRLQSMETDMTLSRGAKKYYINMKMQQHGIRQEAIFEKLTAIGKLWSIGHRDDSWSDKLRNLNIRGMLGDSYLYLFDEHLGDMLEIVANLKIYEANHELRSISHEKQDVVDEIEAQDQKTILDMSACLNLYPESAFEDGLDWLQCFVSCDTLGPLWTCTTEMMKVHSDQCADVVWFGDSLIAIMSSFLNKGHCDFVVDEPVLPAGLTVVEGGEPVEVHFRSYLPPGVLCIGRNPLEDPTQLALAVVGFVFGFNYTCDVEVQLTTANWVDDVLRQGTPGRRPKCRVPNRSLRQVAIGYHDAAVNNSGIFKITDENWNRTFEIPLLPVIDHRLDGDVNVSFTMKMFVQEEMRGKTIKVDVNVIDTDLPGVTRPGPGPGPVECYSLNDPHIMTFDAHYYDNFHQGAFYLYKHTTLPYEVQVIYQPCQHNNNNATCNCAVAVRSGDDVFVMDRCRRCDDSGACEVNQLTVMYTREPITTGTRVFRMNGGLRHDVVLPHGTIVRTVASNDLLNVWIMPGSYDQNNTVGLCGTFNGDTSDDLTMPDGSIFSGPGAAPGGLPSQFNEAWRVPVSEQIFYGSPVLDEPFTILDTCSCTHVLFAGAQCDCGRGSLTEICDLFLENEYTAENISSIVFPSLNNGSSADYLSPIDLDVSYVPTEKTDWTGEWNKTGAEQFCLDLIQESENLIVQECVGLSFGPDDMPAIYSSCVKDIQLLDSTEWQHSVVDNAMYRCYNQQLRDIDTQAAVIEMYLNSSCINECNRQGICDNGVCQCNVGYYGPDCQPNTISTPSLKAKPTETQLCDQRKQLCQFATIFGYNFPNDGTMICQLRNVEISPTGVDYLPKRYTEVWEQPMIVISSNQAVCSLPQNGSYEVFAIWDGEPTPSSQWSNIIPQSFISRDSHHRMRRSVNDVTYMAAPAVEETEVKFIFISYDSACYECDDDIPSCVKKSSQDHCWIESECWAPGDTKPNDPCRYCSPADNMEDWMMSNVTRVCYDQAVMEAEEEDNRSWEMMMRGIIGGSISALVVIIVIIIFCVTRKKEMAEKEEQHLQTASNHVVSDESFGYDNLGLKHDLEAKNYDILRHNSFGSSNKMSRVDVIKSEDIPSRRASSISTTSTISESDLKTAL